MKDITSRCCQTLILSTPMPCHVYKSSGIGDASSCQPTIRAIRSTSSFDYESLLLGRRAAACCKQRGHRDGQSANRKNAVSKLLHGTRKTAESDSQSTERTVIPEAAFVGEDDCSRRLLVSIPGIGEGFVLCCRRWKTRIDKVVEVL